MFLSLDELEAGLELIRQAPQDGGVLERIVRRPARGEREVLEIGELDRDKGLVGDNWSTRGSRRTEDGTSHPDMQLNIMNSRVIGLIARSPDRWQLAGDQLYIDMDLSESSLSPRTRLSLGSAVIEITDQPHTGCKKFVQRFGVDSMKFVNSETGRRLRLRGVNARVLETGTVRVGDIASRISSD